MLLFWWALAYWNGCKSVYVLRGRRSRCPCQAESDVHEPGRIRCDAAATWQHPAQFRHVCPLLKQTPEGWRCSVSPAAVRPFWGRAILAYAVLGGCLYLGVVTAIFGMLSATGARGLAWADVAWPARWRNVTAARVRHFSAEAAAAFARRDLQLAYLSFRSAAEIDPDNYEIASSLVMMEQRVLPPAGAEAAFEWLAQKFPQERHLSAIAYHDTLLGTGRAGELAEFSLRMMRENPAATGIWLRSAITGLRRSGGAATFLKAHAGELTGLATSARVLLLAEEAIELGNRQAARLILARPVDPRPVYVIIQIEQLMRLGETTDADAIRIMAKPALGEFNSFALQYWIEASRGNRDLAQLCFRKLVSEPLTPDHLEWMTAMLVRAPDPECLTWLDLAAAKQAGNLTRSDATAVWAAALAGEDQPVAGRWSSILHNLGKMTLPDYVRLDYTSTDWQDRNSVLFLISFVHLPREVIYALWSRMDGQAPVRQGLPK